MMSDHPSLQELDRFRRHAAGADVRRIGGHLAGCSTCRESTHLESASLSLAVALTAADEHATPEEIEGIATGTAGAALRERVAGHTEACAMCAREIDDLRRFANPPAPRARFWLAAAAAVIFALALLPLFRVREDEPATRPAAAVTIPSEIVAMKGERLLLRGAAHSSDLAVLEPVATAVVSDRPTFHWTMPPGTAVTVEIFDEAFQPLARSEPTVARTWTPAVSLPRGKTYVWQIVTADGKRRLAPAPPLPDARFHVIAPDHARRIATIARNRHPGLELAAAYAAAGALDEARRELHRIETSGSGSDESRRLLRQIENLE